MRKLILLVVLAVVSPLFIAGSVSATSFSLTYDDLLAIDNTPVYGGSASGGLSISGELTGVTFSQELTDNPNSYGYFVTQLLGYNDTSGLSFNGDLNGYDEYTLTIQNVSDESYAAVNLFADSDGLSFTSFYYDPLAWVWVAPGNTVFLSIPLTGIPERGPGYPAKTLDLNNITNIGFLVCLDFTAGGAHPNDGSYDIHVFAEPGKEDPVPEPSTLMFLGTGLVSLVAFIKGRKINKR